MRRPFFEKNGRRKRYKIKSDKRRASEFINEETRVKNGRLSDHHGNVTSGVRIRRALVALRIKRSHKRLPRRAGSGEIHADYVERIIVIRRRAEQNFFQRAGRQIIVRRS